MKTTSHPYVSDFARRYYDEGEAIGEAKALLMVLSARGIDVPEEARRRIAECTDLDELAAWVHRAVTVGKIDELFD